MVDLSKFTSNKMILSKVLALRYNWVCSQTYSKIKFLKKKCSQTLSLCILLYYQYISYIASTM